MAGGASVSPGQSRLLILSSDVLGGGCWYNTPVLSLTHGWCTLTHAPALTNTPTGVHTRVKERSRSWFHGPREPGGGGTFLFPLGPRELGVLPSLSSRLSLPRVLGRPGCRVRFLCCDGGGGRPEGELPGRTVCERVCVPTSGAARLGRDPRGAAHPWRSLLMVCASGNGVLTVDCVSSGFSFSTR